MGVMIQGATRKARLSWNTRALGSSCRERGEEGLSQKPGSPPTPSPAGPLSEPRAPSASTLAYRVGCVQQGDGEEDEAGEAGVWESEALHVEVCAVLAARELQGV